MQAAEAELDIERLKAIRAKVNIPFVLHGSSGVKEESEVEAIQYGICKINVATMLNQAFIKGILRGYRRQARPISIRASGSCSRAMPSRKSCATRCASLAAAAR